MSDVQRFGDEVQRAGKAGFDAAVSAFGEANKGFQAIAAEITAYSKKSLESTTVGDFYEIAAGGQIIFT